MTDRVHLFPTTADVLAGGYVGHGSQAALLCLRLERFLRRRERLRVSMIVIATWIASEVILLAIGQAVFFDHMWSVCWPMNGIMTAMMLKLDKRHWTAVLFGFALGQLHSERAEPIVLNLLMAISNVAEILISAWVLPAFLGLDEWMKKPGLLVRFITWPVILAPALTAIPPAFSHQLIQHKSFWHYALRWQLGDTLGMTMWLPLMLALLSRETYDLFRGKKVWETVSFLIVLVMASLLVFESPWAPPAFIIMPILLLIALRLGFSGSTLAVNILCVIAAHGTVHGRGPFIRFGGDTVDYRVLLLQLFLILSMLMCLPVSVMLLERRGFELDLKSALRRMERLATQDGLTGVANRRAFDEAIDSEWRRAMRDRVPIALMMVDVDFFKSYNDSYGHFGGDDCLRRVAQAIASLSQRSGDLAARYGGEEFAVLLPGVDAARALQSADLVRFAVESLRLEHVSNPHRVVTVSVGCSALVPQPGIAPQMLIERADRALYIAKQNGRNRSEPWTKEQSERLAPTAVSVNA